jgi:hypothetical protein
MVSALDQLRAQARILHRRAATGEPGALARLRAVNVSDHPIRRSHCLTALARELGFAGWPHAVSVLSGATNGDMGTLLYPPDGSAFSNIWCATYEEAREIRSTHGGFLLAYRRQYLVVEEHVIRALGLDPRDPDWTRLDRDWMTPGFNDERARLYAKILAARATVPPS